MPTALQSLLISLRGGASLQSKSVTYTENGTNTVTPDSGYDGLSSVEVTTNVSGGGGETCTITFAGGNNYWFIGFDPDGNLIKRDYYNPISSGTSLTIMKSPFSCGAKYVALSVSITGADVYANNKYLEQLSGTGTPLLTQNWVGIPTSDNITFYADVD